MVNRISNNIGNLQEDKATVFKNVKKEYVNLDGRVLLIRNDQTKYVEPQLLRKILINLNDSVTDVIAYDRYFRRYGNLDKSLGGFVESNAIVEEGVKIDKRSVVFWGARIGSGSVIKNSLVGGEGTEIKKSIVINSQVISSKVNGQEVKNEIIDHINEQHIRELLKEHRRLPG
jgi:UDP-3-O-[3-hydroxymyristoyl] glucosamine N-acyltransferase